MCQRRSCRDPIQRASLSKDIFKDVRTARRQYCTAETKRILHEFRDLKRLRLVHDTPSVASSDQHCSPDAFAELLASVYSSDTLLQSPCKDAIRQLPRFTIEELEKALQRMPLNKCADSFGVTLEMVKYGGPRLHSVLISLMNSLIDCGAVDDNWKHILFSMVPKHGDLSVPSNWRPIAILPIFYKIFSRMLYHRLLPQLDSQQNFDQCGFRPGVRIEDALFVAETLISKTPEWNLPLWMASFGLKKAFDRVQD